MHSPNQIYDYLRYLQVVGEKRTIIRNYKDGILNPIDIWKHSDNSSNPYINDNMERIWRVDPIVDMYDQEPIDVKEMKLQYQHSIDNFDSKGLPVGWSKISNELVELNDIDFFTMVSSCLHIPTICHSEKNSKILDSLLDTGMFIEAHYWFHAVLGRYWFEEYKMHKNTRKYADKKFGLYVRSFDGNGYYRKELLKQLSKIHTNVFYKVPTNLNYNFLNVWDKNNQIVDSDSSARIEWKHINCFDIQIVPETLLDRTHLTEKIFKPIAMYQPFILVGGYQSLKYIKEYGFKTFESCWDESYDNEKDQQIRIDKIVKTINEINELSDTEYKKVIDRAQQIANYNRDLFYSEKFINSIYKELLDNLEYADYQQIEKFNTVPGGTLFHNGKVFKDNFGYIHEKYKDNLKEVYNFCVKNHPTVAKNILKKYSSLL